MRFTSSTSTQSYMHINAWRSYRSLAAVRAPPPSRTDFATNKARVSCPLDTLPIASLHIACLRLCEHVVADRMLIIFATGCSVATGVIIPVWYRFRSAVCTYNDSLTHQCNCAMNGEDITLAGQQELLLEKLNAYVTTVTIFTPGTQRTRLPSVFFCCCVPAIADIGSGHRKIHGWQE